MAGPLKQLLAAGRLRLLASGEVDLADETVLAKALEVLAEFTPEERAAIGEQAVQMGADATVIMALISTAAGEVIEVTGRLRKRWPWWWFAAGLGAAAVGVGGATGYASRRRRRRRLVG